MTQAGMCVFKNEKRAKREGAPLSRGPLAGSTS